MKILVSDRILSPFIYGIVSPKIILPKFLSLDINTELKYILTHELVHMKRADNLRKIILLIAVSIHWFNPFVWMMYVFLNRDIELSCDEEVIFLLGWSKRKEYAMVLTNLAEKQYCWSLFSNGFGNNVIQERIVAIMKFKKVTAVSIVCSVVLVGAAATAFAKNNSSIPEGNRNTYNSISKERKATKAAGTDDRGNAMEIADMGGSDVNIPLIDDLEQFVQYEEYGLYYDSIKNHLVYSGQIVGYFHDEKFKGVYAHITDDEGTVGIVAVRDSEYKLTGLKTVDIPENGFAVETNGGSSSVEKNTASEESGNGDYDSQLIKYKSYGITYDFSKKIWMYKGRRIAGLIDGEDLYFYVYDDGGETDVYLQMNNKSLKAITQKKFDALTGNTE